MNKVVFISQPMNGKTNEEIYTERKELVQKLEEDGYEVVDSVIADSPPDDYFEAVYYLGHSLILMSEVDYVYFMDGWGDARGCRIEHTVAREYGIPILKE